MVLSTPIPTGTASDYCRQARKLRHQHARNPGRLHESLRQLGENRLAIRTDAPVHSTIDVIRRDFAQNVADALDGPVLRYSRRQNLLRKAGQLGIGRFEANLIIAAAQHRNKETIAPTPVSSHPRRIPSWVLFAMIQTTILAAAWAALS